MLSHNRLVLIVLMISASVYIGEAFPVSACGKALSKYSATNTTDSNLPPNSTYTSQGWTQSPNERGSFDILWSCGSVMILCSWSILCLNVPDPDETRLRGYCRRAWLTALGFLGPEFIFQAALGQWISARRSVKDFKEAGVVGWQQKHAFHADAGGFVLRTPDLDHDVPLNSRQLLFLVKNGFVDLGSTVHLAKYIDDCNKKDAALRVITSFQTMWFIVNFLGRLVERLPVTGLEITTIAFVFCALGTTYCWWHKPADVTTSIILESSSSLEEIRGGAPTLRHDHSPLDCVVPRQEWHWSKFWRHWINILRWMKIEKVLFVEYADEPGDGRYIRRIENTHWYSIHGAWIFVFLAMSVGYTVIFLSSWNEVFPTRIEGLLWRISCILMAVSVVGYFLVVLLWCNDPESDHNTRCNLSKEDQSLRYTSRVGTSRDTFSSQNIDQTVVSLNWWYRWKNAIRNNSSTQDPLLDVDVRAQLTMYFFGVAYCTARSYLFVTDITQLRSLPGESYITVAWPGWFPHIA